MPFKAFDAVQDFRCRPRDSLPFKRFDAVQYSRLRSRLSIPFKTSDAVQDFRCRSRLSIPFKTSDTVQDFRCRSRISMPSRLRCRSRLSMISPSSKLTDFAWFQALSYANYPGLRTCASPTTPRTASDRPTSIELQRTNDSVTSNVHQRRTILRRATTYARRHLNLMSRKPWQGDDHEG
jgi:hypothetical protein